jgi:peptide deformylase
MSARDEIVVSGNPVLKQDCEPISEITSDIRDLASRMLDAMYEAEGCGLAAPQLGVPVRMVVIDVDWGEGEKNPYVLINPTIISTSEETRWYDEGCLSFPGITVPIERPAGVCVQAQNLDGDLMQYDAENSLMAVCLQHEIDHVNGVTMVDHLGPLARMRALDKVRHAIAEGAVPGDTGSDAE